MWWPPIRFISVKLGDFALLYEHFSQRALHVKIVSSSELLAATCVALVYITQLYTVAATLRHDKSDDQPWSCRPPPTLLSQLKHSGTTDTASSGLILIFRNQGDCKQTICSKNDIFGSNFLATTDGIKQLRADNSSTVHTLHECFHFLLP